MSNYTIIDGDSIKRTFKSSTIDSVNIPHHNIDALPAEHIDAFSRLRVSSPGYRFDSQLTNQIDADLWDSKVTGDGTIAHDGTNRKATVTAGATAGANTAIFQSHYHSPYTPGRGQLVFITFAMPGVVPTNGEVGCGYFDGNNGVYLKRTASGLSLNLDSTTSHADASIAQASWNIDSLDGTGPSGITLDATKTNILAIQIQALYVGRVVVGFDIGGSFIPAHAFEHANIASHPYMAQASLPVRYWATTSTDASAATIHAICSSVISDGGEDLTEIQGRTFVSYGENTDVDAAAEAVLVIRPKAQLNGINQNAVVIPTELDIAVAVAGCWVEVRANATITAGTFTNVSTGSVVEESFAGNAGTDPVVTAGTGTLIDKFYLPASSQIRSTKGQGLGGKVVLAYSHLLATADNIAIMALGGSNSEVRAALKWREVR